MPYSIRKIGKNKYQVYNTATGEVHSKGTTKKKAEGQFRLLQGIARNEPVSLEGGMSDWTQNRSRRIKLPPIPERTASAPAPAPAPRFYTDIAKRVGEKTPLVKKELKSAIKELNDMRKQVHLAHWDLEGKYNTASDKGAIQSELARLGSQAFQLEQDSKELQKLVTEMGSLTASGRRRGGEVRREQPAVPDDDMYFEGQLAVPLAERLEQYDDAITNLIQRLNNDMVALEDAFTWREEVLETVRNGTPRQQEVARNQLLDLQGAIRRQQRLIEERRELLDRSTQRRNEIQQELSRGENLIARGRCRGGANRRSYVGGSRVNIARIEEQIVGLYHQAHTIHTNVETLRQRRAGLDRLIERHPAILNNPERVAEYNNLSATINTMGNEIINIANQVHALVEERSRLLANLDNEDDISGILDDSNDREPPTASAGSRTGRGQIATPAPFQEYQPHRFL